MVCVGDKVRVSCEGGIYTTYQNFITKYMENFSSEHTRTVGRAYLEHTYPVEPELAHNFTVEYVARHDLYDRAVAVISSESTGRVFIYNANALSVVTPVSSIHVGDRVTVLDPEHTYSGWKTLIDSQKGIIPDFAIDRWIETATPAKGTEGTVLWVGRHICWPYEGIVCIIEAQSGVFILGSEALECSEGSGCDWEKYIAYVRNWCTKHKDFTPQADAGPLSRPDWERQYKAHTLAI